MDPRRSSLQRLVGPGLRNRDDGDSVQGTYAGRPFDVSATAWLVGEGVRYLNIPGTEGEVGYARVVELLRSCTDAQDTLSDLLRQFGSGDAPVRWNILYVLGDVSDSSVAEVLVDLALEPLPENDRHEGCEGARDSELLVRTRAVQSLRAVAERHPDAAEHLLRVVASRPDRAILIPAVQAAVDLGLEKSTREVLRDEDQWILNIRRARAEEVFADPERKDGAERGFTPPRIDPDNMAPRVAGGGRKDE